MNIGSLSDCAILNSDLIEQKESFVNIAHPKPPIDNGGRRIPDNERRAYAYTAHIPERRTGEDRRKGKDRRKE